MREQQRTLPAYVFILILAGSLCYGSVEWIGGW